MAVVIHSVCAVATIAHDPVERSSISSRAFRCCSRPWVTGCPEPVRDERKDGAALRFLRLGKGSQIVALVGHHFGQADADRPDGREKGGGGLLRPAVGRPENLYHPLLRLPVRRRSPCRFCHNA